MYQFNEHFMFEWKINNSSWKISRTRTPELSKKDERVSDRERKEKKTAKKIWSLDNSETKNIGTVWKKINL